MTRFPTHIRLITRALQGVRSEDEAIQADVVAGLHSLRLLSAATTNTLGYGADTSLVVKQCGDTFRRLADVGVFNGLSDEWVRELCEELNGETDESEAMLDEDFATVSAASKTLAASLIDRCRATCPKLACGIDGRCADETKLRDWKRLRGIPVASILGGIAGAMSVAVVHALVQRRM